MNRSSLNLNWRLLNKQEQGRSYIILMQLFGTISGATFDTFNLIVCEK